MMLTTPSGKGCLDARAEVEVVTNVVGIVETGSLFARAVRQEYGRYF